MKQLYMYVIKNLALILLIIAWGLPLSAQETTRIEELQGNEEYMTLLQQKSTTSTTEAKLSAELAENRKLYNEGGANSTALRQKIIDIEQSLIDISVEKNSIISKINAIEQQWAMSQSGRTEDSTTHNDTAPTSGEDAKRISQSHYAQETLSTMDIKNLAAAELAESRVAAIANSYISNYKTLASLSVEYDNAQTQEDAEAIMNRYNRVDSLNRSVAKRLPEEWNGVVDNKNFAFAMLIERSGDTSLFSKEESFKIKRAKLVDSLRTQTSSEELLDYYASRLSMVELEYALASTLNLRGVADSLRTVRDSLRIVEFSYPAIAITPRLFIEYEPIKFSSKPIYTSANPIPDGKIYESGVIYRLLVGSFKSRQAATLFRGAYPIYIIKNDSGLLSYYLGGYKSREEADKARDMLLRKGFKRPIVVEWQDGAAPGHTVKNTQSKSKYRVEISGISELSPTHRSTIQSQGSGKELSKIGVSTFVIGLFDSHKSAEHLMESLKIVDSSLSISIIEVK